MGCIHYFGQNWNLGSKFKSCEIQLSTFLAIDLNTTFERDFDENQSGFIKTLKNAWDEAMPTPIEIKQLEMSS